MDEAVEVFERLLEVVQRRGPALRGVRPAHAPLVGNFPQAFTHMALVNTARLLSMPAHSLSERCLHGDRPATVRADEHPAQTTVGAGPETIG